jgi:hypothetical protein
MRPALAISLVHYSYASGPRTDHKRPAEAESADDEAFVQIMGPPLYRLEDGSITLGQAWRQLTLIYM